MEGNPIERDWHVMHLAGRALPSAAAAFEQFLRVHGQAWIHWQLEQMRHRAGGPAAAPASSAALPAAEVPVRPSKKTARRAA